MENSKERFIDFVNEFKDHVKESKDAFINAEVESDKVLESKIAKNIDFREKIEERLETRTEKHNASISKTSETTEEKFLKSNTLHDSKLQQIEDDKEKNLESIITDLEKEKVKLEKALSKLENNFVKEEKRCLTTIEKAEKKAASYNEESNVNKTEKDSQNQIKNIEDKLSKSLTLNTEHSAQVKELIDKLKNIQASLEILYIEYDSRVIKLKLRVQQEELNNKAKIASLEETKQREELKSLYDLDKIITNYEYNIIQETLKTEERKIDLEYKINKDKEELRYYTDTQELKRDRKFQLEKEQVALETIIQKDKGDNVKNNFALSNKEHKNLFIFSKAINSLVSQRETINYKLSIEEIDIRSKQLLERIKLSISELKTSLDYITSKVQTNLKTELKMPTEQIKLIETKYKKDAKELTKIYENQIKDINRKLSLLDPTFDSDEMKEQNTLLEDTKNRYLSNSKELETDYKNIVTAYQNKIDYASKRSKRILLEARKLYDAELELYNNELQKTKDNADQEKQHAKQLLESIQTLNNNNLQFVKEQNDLAIKQNDELSSYLVDLSLSNIQSAQQENERRDQVTLDRFNDRVNAKTEWLNKNESIHQKAISELDNKLTQYRNMIEKKLETEKKDVEKNIEKRSNLLRNNLNKLAKEYKKVTNAFDKAMKDAEIEFTKANKKLINEKSLILNQLESLTEEQNTKVSKHDYDIFYEEVKKPKTIET